MSPRNSLEVAGAIMVLSGVAHAIFWAMTGESWEGPYSIRKPILFGISTGVTVISLGWISKKLKPARRDAWLFPILAASLLIEVALITMQYWRGEASHFNHSSFFDLAVDRSITVLIVIASAIILDIALRSFQFLEANSSMKLAIQGGLGFLLVSCALGFFILFYGEHLASRGETPTIYGQAGVMKFPHGITIHAVQYLPILVWAMSVLKIAETRKLAAVRYAVASLTMFLWYSIWQTFNGLARFDMNWQGAIALAVAVGLAIAAAYQIAMGIRAGQAGEAAS